MHQNRGMLRFASPLRAAEYRLDVDDRRAVDGFNWSDAQAVPVDPAHGDGMETQRVRPVRRSRGKHTGERIPFVGSWVDSKDVATGPVKPRDHDDLVANGKALESF